MFSRFSKTTPPGRPAAPTAAPVAAVEKPGLAARVPAAVSQKAAAEALAADRDKKRKERLTELKVQIHKRLLEDLNLAALESATEQSLKQEISSLASEALDEMSVALNKDDRLALNQELYDEVMGLGPLEPLLKDETINDILVNGPKRIFVERRGKLELSDVTFRDERHLLRIIDKIVSAVGRRVDESNPYCDARLQDGSRFNCMIPPIAVDGSLVSIRKFKKDKLKIQDLVNFGAFTEEMAAYLQAAVSCRLNIIVSGGTGSGKTTTLNALSSFIDNHERVLTIEDTAELQLQQVHVGRMESRPPNVEGKGAVTQRDCLRNALRMRPDRIIVGETRGEEVIDMLQAMNTGHDGSMTTIHANNPRDAISRLENMVAMAGIEMPLKAVRSQIASAVNLMVQASRLQDGTRRMTSITEITGMEGEVISMQEVFRFERLGIEPNGRIIGRFNATGLRSAYSDRFRQWGFDLPASIYEPVIQDMEISVAPLIYILIFVAVVVIVEGIYLTVFGKSISLNSRLSRRLSLLEKNANREQVLEQLRKEMNQHLNAKNIPLYSMLAKKAQRANIAFSPQALIGIMGLVSAVAFLLLTVLTPAALAVRVILGLVMGVGGVYTWINRKAKKRMELLEEQLPDSIELMVRSLRVGHPFSTALGIVAKEIPDPLGSEFGVISDEAAYGRDVTEALKAFAERMDSQDLRFLAVAVSIQQQSGGNLAEILDGLAKVIRARFKLFRRVKAITAEAKWSGMFLSAFPIVALLMIIVIKPDYYDSVRETAAFIPAALFVMVFLIINIIFMKVMTNIKV